MSVKKTPAFDLVAGEPAWGAEGWPRVENELDEGDISLIREMLNLTPLERLRRLENFVNGLNQIKRVQRLPSD